MPAERDDNPYAPTQSAGGGAEGAPRQAPGEAFDPDAVYVAQPPAGGYEPELFDVAPAWPRVIGTISLVWGILGGVFGLCGLVATSLSANVVAGAMGVEPDQLPPNLQPDAQLYTMQGVGLAVVFLLIIAGVTLRMRLPAARWLHLAYGVAGVASAFISIRFSLDMQIEMAAFVKENPDSVFAQRGGGSSSGLFSMVGLAIGAFFGLAWPTFCLVWFGFVKTSVPQEGRPVA